MIAETRVLGNMCLCWLQAVSGCTLVLMLSAWCQGTCGCVWLDGTRLLLLADSGPTLHVMAMHPQGLQQGPPVLPVGLRGPGRAAAG